MKQKWIITESSGEGYEKCKQLADCATPPLLRSCEKIEMIGHAGISSKFYNCGSLEGRVNMALQLISII